MHIIKNPKTDDYILENLFEREDTDKWSELDRLILSHPNCPKILKNSENTKDSLPSRTAFR